MDVKASTREAKQAALMTLVYHHLVYMVFHRLVTVKNSMISKEFATKLAAAKSDAQLDELVDNIVKHQFPDPIQKNWSVPNLENMEVEVMHLITYWKDKKVSLIKSQLTSEFKLMVNDY